jgi:hypothetical protein
MYMPLSSALVGGFSCGAAMYVVETIEFIAWGPINGIRKDNETRLFLSKCRNIVCCAIVAAMLSY